MRVWWSQSTPAIEGATIIADFNKPLEDRHHGKFSSFIDFGAMEHIFNVHQVLVNINKILRTNGTALLLLPSNGYLGHGFYQFSPEFFYSTLIPKNGFSQTIVSPYRGRAGSLNVLV